MESLFNDKKILNSKVARRILLLFILCALIPLVAISGVSFVFVGNQLKDEAFERLRQQSKSKGMEIYEHLLLAEGELLAIGQEIVEGSWRNENLAPYDAAKFEGSRFKSISLIAGEAKIPLPVAPFGSELELPAPSKNHLGNGHALVTTQAPDEGPVAIYILRLLDIANPAGGILIGEIDPVYLWGIGLAGAMPAGVELAVCTPSKQVLISSLQGENFSSSIWDAFSRVSFRGTFEDEKQGQSHINAYWSLFLRHRFASPDWVIIMSQSKTSILSPFTKFAVFFFLLILLTFWVILLLSVITIKKRMVPVETLKAGAKKIASGEFGHQVAINSGDEFEDLGETFNEMSSKLKQGQIMLVQAAKMSAFGQMSAGVVHEIGQPLMAISGYTDLLQHSVAEEKAQNHLAVMKQEVVRLTEIIDKFRTFSRASTEVLSPIDINDILDHTYKLLKHQIEMQSVELRMEQASGLPKVDGEKNALQQVFMNLIINAVHALEGNPQDNRRINVKSFSNNGSVCISIEDNGCGIPLDIQESIFDPFFTTKSEDKGTGLGLAIIQSIVHKHGAAIELASAPDQGAQFTITLPISSSNLETA